MSYLRYQICKLNLSFPMFCSQFSCHVHGYSLQSVPGGGCIDRDSTKNYRYQYTSKCASEMMAHLHSRTTCLCISYLSSSSLLHGSMSSCGHFHSSPKSQLNPTMTVTSFAGLSGSWLMMLRLLWVSGIAL